MLTLKQRADGSWMIKSEASDYAEPEEEKLTPENCPRYLTITANVDPTIQKGKLIKAINQSLKWNLDILLKAQESVLEKKSLRPRFGEFGTYKNVYDLREKGNSWRAIAKEVLPEDAKSEILL